MVLRATFFDIGATPNVGLKISTVATICSAASKTIPVTGLCFDCDASSSYVFDLFHFQTSNTGDTAYQRFLYSGTLLSFNAVCHASTVSFSDASTGAIDLQSDSALDLANYAGIGPSWGATYPSKGYTRVWGGFRTDTAGLFGPSLVSGATFVTGQQAYAWPNSMIQYKKV